MPGLSDIIVHMRVRVVSLGVILVGLVISFGLAKNLYIAYQNSKILSDSEKNLTELREENSRLKSEVSEASDPSYVDDEARKKLGLVKPGEVEVILPNHSQAEVQATQSSQPEQRQETEQTSFKAGRAEVVWKQWWDFLFGG